MVQSGSAGGTFQAIRRERASRQIAEQLEAVILGGQYHAGDRLPTERELAERFGTSRSSVREALRSLEQLGLVEVRRGAGGGAFVSAPGAGLVGKALHRLAQLGQFDLEQLFAARGLIEPAIVAEAARQARPEQLEALAVVVDDARALALAGQDTALASRRFHLLLAEASGNPLLVLVNASLLELAERLDSAIPHRPRPIHLVVEDHAALVAALRARDAETARQLAAEHLAALARQALSEQRASDAR